jgi:AraC-like DNA-binding protein
MHSLLSILFFIAGITGFTVAVIIICRKENVGKNLFLSLCLFGLACGCIYNLSLSEERMYNLPDLSGIIKAFAFLIAPCAYLYVRNTINNTEKMKLRDWLHFVPFAVAFFYILTNISLTAVPAKNISASFWTMHLVGFSQHTYTFNIFKTTVWLFYAYTQTLLLLQLKDNGRAYNPKMLQWLKLFSFAGMVLFTSLLIQAILNISFVKLDITDNVIATFILFSSALFLFFKPYAVFEMKEPEILLFTADMGVVEDTDTTVRKLNTPVYTEDKAKKYIEQLNVVLAANEPFLQKGFVIRDLSDLTGIPTHHLSYLINSEYNMHFQDFINQRRIDYLKSKMNDKEWKNLSLEGMAWAVGFKSRTTFFRAFIKLTGQSPSEYFHTQKRKKPANYTATA